MNKYIIKGIIFIMCIALGIVIPYQIRNNIGDNIYVPLDTIKETQKEVDKTKSEIADIKKLIKVQEDKLDEIKSIDNTKEIVELLEEDIEKFKTTGGFNDLEGPGLILTIRDSDKEFAYGDSSGLVHDGDIQNILNDLKVAGAEAISIRGEEESTNFGGQRIILNSPVRCMGPVIHVNNTNVVAPFIITAIGDPKKLYAAINAPGTYGRYLMDGRGLKLESEERDYIVVPGYRSTLDLNYIKPVEEGE